MLNSWTLRLTLAAASVHLALPVALAGSSGTHSITIKNNSGYTTEVQAFNNNDTARMFPASRATIERNTQKVLTCNTSGSCYISADYTNSSGQRIGYPIGERSTCILLNGSGDYIYSQSC